MALSVAGRYHGFLSTLLGEYHVGGSVYSAYTVYRSSDTLSVEMERKRGCPFSVFGGDDLWFERWKSWDGGFLSSCYFNIVLVLVPEQSMAAPLDMRSIFYMWFFGLYVFTDSLFN